MGSGASALAEMREIVKTFPQNNLTAVNKVSFSLASGEIHGLVGENGAGKTTLMNILSGLIRPEKGEIIVAGEKQRFTSPKEALACGIGMIHQHPFIVPEFSVWENIVLGREPQKFFSLNKQQAVRAIERTIAAYTIDFSIDLDMKMMYLTASEMRKVSLIAMLLFDVRVLILDEPTSTYTEQEKEVLFSLLDRLRKKGWGIIFITHKIEEIINLADRITILRKGSVINTVESKNTSVTNLSAQMLGERAATERETAQPAGANHVAPKSKTASNGLPRKAVLEATGIAVGKKEHQILHDITFSVYTGEIVAVAGIREVGLETLEDVLTGFRKPDRGTVAVCGRELLHYSPEEFRTQGAAYIPTERLSRGASLYSTVRENIMLHQHRRLSRYGVLSKKAADRLVRSLTRSYAIAAEPGQPLYQLSGGNINKVIIARELYEQHPLIIFTEPTWGLDMHAGSQVLGEIKQLRDSGKGILIISSDIDEVLYLADTIVVLREGMVTTILDNRDLSKRILGRYLLGLGPHKDLCDDQ
jgi:general nucleoside transport system ATP-binding protein